MLFQESFEQVDAESLLGARCVVDDDGHFGNSSGDIFHEVNRLAVGEWQPEREGDLDGPSANLLRELSPTDDLCGPESRAPDLRWDFEVSTTFYRRLGDLLPFFGCLSVELTGGAVGIDSVNPDAANASDILSQRLLVNLVSKIPGYWHSSPHPVQGLSIYWQSLSPLSPDSLR